MDSLVYSGKSPSLPLSSPCLRASHRLVCTSSASHRAPCPGLVPGAPGFGMLRGHASEQLQCRAVLERPNAPPCKPHEVPAARRRLARQVGNRRRVQRHRLASAPGTAKPTTGRQGYDINVPGYGVSVSMTPAVGATKQGGYEQLGVRVGKWTPARHGRAPFGNRTGFLVRLAASVRHRIRI